MSSMDYINLQILLPSLLEQTTNLANCLTLSVLPIHILNVITKKVNSKF